MANALTADTSISEARGLSQAERVVDTFIAPSKTFADIRRSASWWLPFLLLVLVMLASALTVQRQVGFDRASENQIHASPKTEERLNALAPEQKARQMAMTTSITKATTFAMPLLFLAAWALYSLILWASFNFGLGAQTNYRQVLAVTVYSGLPYLLLYLITMATLYFGGNAEAYDYKSPIGSNLAYYMPDAAPWIRSVLATLDVFKLWSVALQTIGMAIIARKSITQSAIIVGGWYVISMLFAGATGAFS